jgi:hypothetical protein
MTICSFSGALSHLLAELSSRSHYNVVGAALAYKLARIAWAMPRRHDFMASYGTGPHFSLIAEKNVLNSGGARH